ncbi:MAG TPA: Ku protein [Devosiaceae bacterium]
MAPRATWKGFIKVSELTVPIALYAGATTSERLSFHIINRKTGNRVHREYVDEKTGKPVAREQQVKGYETGENKYVILEPEEIAEAVPDSDKALRIEAFIDYPDVDTVYLDKPYYLAPYDKLGSDAFAIIREGMKRKKVVALARAVLFRRVRTLLIRADDKGLVANTLNFDYEVRNANKVFEELPQVKIQGEMLELAKHIIGTMRGKFDPSKFDDRYEEALAELVRAKIEGRAIKAPKPPKETKVVSLLDALRQSAKAPKAAASRKESEPAKRKKAS